jgi:hypothetical protein
MECFWIDENGYTGFKPAELSIRAQFLRSKQRVFLPHNNFINPEERYPVIATTSKLMTTGVDAQTCKLVVLD